MTNFPTSIESLGKCKFFFSHPKTIKCQIYDTTLSQDHLTMIGENMIFFV